MTLQNLVHKMGGKSVKPVTAKIPGSTKVTSYGNKKCHDYHKPLRVKDFHRIPDVLVPKTASF